MLQPAAPDPATLSERERRRQSSQPREMNAHDGWSQPLLHLTALAQQQQPFRLDTQPKVELILLPDEDDEDYQLHRIDPGQRRYEQIYVPVENSLHQRIADSELAGCASAPGVLPTTSRPCLNWHRSWT